MAFKNKSLLFTAETLHVIYIQFLLKVQSFLIKPHVMAYYTVIVCPKLRYQGDNIFLSKIRCPGFYSQTVVRISHIIPLAI